MRSAPDLSWMAAGPAPVRAPSGRALPAEREADAVASDLTGAGARSRDDRASAVATAYAGPALGTAQRLDPRDQAHFERRLGADLSGVRIHADDAAAAAAQSEGARAFTAGEHVVFARSAYQPATAAGRRLLAHELAHVLQQRGKAPVVQREAEVPVGIGRTPPPIAYDVGEGHGREDAFVLFGKDAVEPDTSSVERLAALARQRTGPVRVDLHGYASGEGEPQYNLNLSAHRAYRIRLLLEPLLPPGSELHITAYGESSAFGQGRNPNRRVGLVFTDLPRERLRLTPPTLGDGESRFGVPRLKLDPSLLVPPPGMVVPPGGTRFLTPPVAPTPVLPTPLPQLVPPLHPPLVGPDPLRPPALPPPSSLDPSMFRLTPEPPRVDWLRMRQSYQSRGVPLQDRDARAIETHWQRAYDLARRAGLSPAMARSAANAAVGSIVDRELAREHPNVADRLDSDMRTAYPEAWRTPQLGWTWEF